MLFAACTAPSVAGPHVSTPVAHGDLARLDGI